MRRVLVAGMVLLAAFACSTASAPVDRAHAIEAQVWSPYCPGRLLIDCTTSQARELRTQIQQRVDHGDSSEDVIAWVRREFGDEAIAEPKTSGIGLVVWLFPAVVFLAGAAVVVRVLRKGRTDVSRRPTTSL
jgi:cytochrome c-type biogenesis protein CcmH